MAQKRFKLDRKVPTARGLVCLWGVEHTGSSDRLVDHSGYRHDCTASGAGEKWIQDFERGHNVMLFPGAVAASWEAPSPGTIFDGKAVSFAAWVYPVLSGNGFPGFVDRVTNAQFNFYWKEAGTTFGATIISTGGTHSNSALAAVTLNTWQHVVYTWDKDDLRLYINGVLTATDALFDDGALAVSTGVMRIGQSSEGRMTGMRLYDRVVAAGEVAHIFNNTQDDPFGDLRHKARRRTMRRHGQRAM